MIRRFSYAAHDSLCCNEVNPWLNVVSLGMNEVAF